MTVEEELADLRRKLEKRKTRAGFSVNVREVEACIKELENK